MNSDTVLFLSSHDVRALLTIDECIVAVENAFRLHGERKTLSPAVLSVHVPNGAFHVKAGALSLSKNYFATKVNGNFPDNPAHFALPTIQGLIVLCDANNGVPLTIVDSRDITASRTAAATAVAVKYLARPDSGAATICGCGIQGRAQLAALSRVFPLKTVFAYDKNLGQASVFAGELSSELSIPIDVSDDLNASIRRSDVCVTCTTACEAFIGEDHLHPGLFIAAVGADNPHKQEIHAAAMAQSKIVCDVIEQCASMGDLHHALNAGVVKTEDVHAELGEIVAGRKPGRESAEEVIVFDSTGMALQDVAATALIYEKAIREEVGTVLQLAA
jgi:ornithine cyclodeaminase/alanine dehydrogenase-like protein (mu-crystallin family)